MLAILLALFSAAGYGSSDYAGGLGARRAGIIRVTILAEGVSAVLMWSSCRSLAYPRPPRPLSPGERPPGSAKQ